MLWVVTLGLTFNDSSQMKRIYKDLINKNKGAVLFMKTIEAN